jgi:hypothetical protein
MIDLHPERQIPCQYGYDIRPIPSVTVVTDLLMNILPPDTGLRTSPAFATTPWQLRDIHRDPPRLILSEMTLAITGIGNVAGDVPHLSTITCCGPDSADARRLFDPAATFQARQAAMTVRTTLV